LEAGVSFKVSSAFNIKALGTISDAQYINNANVRYLNSTKATYHDDIVMNKGMRESGTPLTAASLIFDFHANGWFCNLNCNYYDRFYLGYSPSYRYQGTLTTMQRVNNDGTYDVPEQAKGKGGFMLDGSIGKSLRLRHGRQLSINLMITNILNNQKLCTGGYEQSRSDYTVKQVGDDVQMNNQRAYKFSLNPKKYYAYGINGMLNLTYRF
jgi:outer membrane receptor protein involved in Fe transport